MISSLQNPDYVLIWKIRVGQQVILISPENKILKYKRNGFFPFDVKMLNHFAKFPIGRTLFQG
jgi:hypothetical protein